MEKIVRKEQEVWRALLPALVIVGVAFAMVVIAYGVESVAPGVHSMISGIQSECPATSLGTGETENERYPRFSLSPFLRFIFVFLGGIYELSIY